MIAMVTMTDDDDDVDDDDDDDDDDNNDDDDDGDDKTVFIIMTVRNIDLPDDFDENEEEFKSRKLFKVVLLLLIQFIMALVDTVTEMK